MEQVIIREAVGIFDNMDALQAAVDDLENKTFAREDISVMGDPKEVEQVFGASAVPPARAESDPRTPRRPLIRTSERAVGAGALISVPAYLCAVTAALFAAILHPPSVLPAAVLAGLSGGLLGFGVMRFVRRHLDKTTQEQLQKGGLLLWVRTPDSRHEQSACKIMRERGARHVRIHDIVY